MASIAALQAASSAGPTGIAVPGVAARLCVSARDARGAGMGVRTMLEDGTVGLGGRAVAAAAADGAGTGGAVTARTRSGSAGCCLESANSRSGMASISNDSPTSSSNEASQILTGHTGLVATGPGSGGMARLDEIA